MEFQSLKPAIAEIAEIAAELPKAIQSVCFELLLRAHLEKHANRPIIEQHSHDCEPQDSHQTAAADLSPS